MDTKELDKALDGLKEDLKGATSLEIKNALDDFKVKQKEAFELEVKNVVDPKLEEQRTAFELELKTKVEELQTKFAADIKVVQDHADKLDVAAQKNQGGKMEQKSFGEVLSKAIEEKTDDYQKFLRKETSRFALDLKAVGDVSTANVTGGTRYGELMRPGIIENPNTKTHMSSILASGSVGAGNTFTFMRENGDGEGAIAPVSENATKSQFDVDLVETTVNIETIAGWIRVTKKAMNNIPGFVSFLQSRLPEKFEDVKDAQVLYGTGTTPELSGILTVGQGNFVASTSTISNPLIEKLIDDISLLEDTHKRMATDIVLRPVDYYGFFKNKASGSGEYDLPQGASFVNGQLFLFGIPVHKTTAITAPDYIVGDFRQGAQLLTQEGMRIEFFEQDGDNVRTNKVTVRIEGNYALPVYGSNYFVKGTTALA